VKESTGLGRLLMVRTCCVRKGWSVKPREVMRRRLVAGAFALALFILTLWIKDRKMMTVM
jgi:hypothetical protein